MKVLVKEVFLLASASIATLVGLAAAGEVAWRLVGNLAAAWAIVFTLACVFAFATSHLRGASR